MASFIKHPNGRSAKDTAAIIGGVPRGAIAGIVVTIKMLENQDLRLTLPKYFPCVPVFTQDVCIQSLQLSRIKWNRGV
jgi:hypothetical protein